MACLDAEALERWVGGSLSEDERAAALAHIADCTACRQAVSALARIEPTVHGETAFERPIAQPPIVEHRRPWVVIGAAAIAGAAVAVVAALWLGRTPSAPGPAPATIAAQPLPAADAAPPGPSTTIVPAPRPPPPPEPPRPVERPRAATPIEQVAPPPAPPARGERMARLHQVTSIAGAMGGPGEWRLRPGTQLLIPGTPRGAQDGLHDMGDWWLEVTGDVPGAELLASPQRRWIIATFARFGELDERSRPKPVLKALEVHASLHALQR